MATVRRLLITGANGNLGQKAARHFLRGTGADTWHVKLLDDYSGFCKGVANDPSHEAAAEGEGALTGSLEFVDAKIERFDKGWGAAFEDLDAVIHFAAWNPYPEADWNDSKLSTLMTANVLEAATAADVPRFVYTSSNHVFGRYWREGPTLSESGGRVIDSSTPPNVGTQFRIPSFDCDATPYAAAKLAGECMTEAAAMAAAARGARFTGVSLRIGWCQPGENHPDTLSLTGSPNVADGDGDDAVAAMYSDVARGFDDPVKLQAWFENMWLSNADLARALQSCVTAGHVARDGALPPYDVVFGMSANADMRWGVLPNSVGYNPRDDVHSSKS